MSDEMLAGSGDATTGGATTGDAAIGGAGGDQYVSVTLAVPAAMVGTVYRTVGELLEARALGDVLGDDPVRGHSRR